MKFKRLTGKDYVGNVWESVSPDLLPYDFDAIVRQEIGGTIRWWGVGDRGTSRINSDMAKQELIFQSEQGGAIDD